ncbi:MAG: ribose-phosphate pyrophosphokinase [Chloroflexi bacterium]|nr:ribose-phosphate pyrophosphokinase [Chloroflexota bacterium]
MYGDIKLFAGSSTPELAQRVADYLGIPLERVDLIEFPNENLFVRLHRSVRGQDVYIIQTTSRPVHRNLMELLIMLQTVRLDSAARITAVVPYLCYARSDKKDQPRVPITARLVADMIQVAGADRYITFDLHAGQIQGFFSIPGDVLTAFHLLRDYVQGLIPQLHRPVVVSVDLGFAKKARNFAEALGLPIAFVEKRRLMDGSGTEVLSVVGDVAGRDVILVDDEVDTAGSVTNAYRAVKQHGARDVYLAFVHPVFSDPAIDRLSALDLKRIITTDTVPIPEAKRARLGDRLVVLTIAEMLGEVIRRAHEGRSVGALFNE